MTPGAHASALTIYKQHGQQSQLTQCIQPMWTTECNGRALHKSNWFAFDGACTACISGKPQVGRRVG
eukprot:2719144-Amphidinium_carterae.1